jgi:hypothetical protein
MTPGATHAKPAMLIFGNDAASESPDKIAKRERRFRMRGRFFNRPRCTGNQTPGSIPILREEPMTNDECQILKEVQNDE